MNRLALPMLVLFLAWLPAANADEQKKEPLSVLYVGTTQKDRAALFEKFLRRHFAQVKVADRTSFDASAAKDVDVVVFDWSQSDSSLESTELPFGRLEDWDKPTVLLNHAGLLVARKWQVIGDAG